MMLRSSEVWPLSATIHALQSGQAFVIGSVP
jgi:hypothetical protein